MAIGKVNAYATVDAPKADFGAVAQLNIDNLVKSAKEDEQLKAAKKAAEAKAKQEAAKEFGDFKVLDATGFNLQDQYSAQETKKLLGEFVENKNLYIETKDPQYLTKKDSLLAYINSVNSNSAILKEDISNFSKLAGADSIAPKFKDRGMNLVNLLGDGNTVFSRGEDGNGKVGLYNTLEDGKTRELKETLDYRDYLSLIKNAPKKVVFQDEFTKDKGLFEKNLTETQVTSLKKTGLEKISPDTEAAMLKYARSKMNDDSFMAAWGDESGLLAKDDYRVKGFSSEKDGERDKAARLYADKLKTFYGIKSTVDTKQAPTPAKGDGKDELGTVTVETESAVRDLKLTGLSSFTGDKEFTVPPNSMSYAIQPLNLKDTSRLNSVKGGKSGFATTPTSFVVTPEGKAYVVSNTAATEGYNVGVASGSGKVQSETFIIPFGTPEFKEAISGFVNLQPTLEFQGKKYKIKSSRDIYNYLSDLEKGFNQRELPALKVSGSSSEADKLKI